MTLSRYCYDKILCYWRIRVYHFACFQNWILIAIIAQRKQRYKVLSLSFLVCDLDSCYFFPVCTMSVETCLWHRLHNLLSSITKVWQSVTQCLRLHFHPGPPESETEWNNGFNTWMKKFTCGFTYRDNGMKLRSFISFWTSPTFPLDP